MKGNRWKPVSEELSLPRTYTTLLPVAFPWQTNVSAKSWWKLSGSLWPCPHWIFRYFCQFEMCLPCSFISSSKILLYFGLLNLMRFPTYEGTGHPYKQHFTCFPYSRVPAWNLRQPSSSVSQADLLTWGSLLGRQDLPGCFLGLPDAFQLLLIWGVFPGWLNFRGTEQCKSRRVCCDLCRRFPLLTLFFHPLACSYFKRQTSPSHPLWDGNDWSSSYLIFFFFSR